MSTPNLNEIQLENKAYGSQFVSKPQETNAVKPIVFQTTAAKDESPVIGDQYISSGAMSLQAKSTSEYLQAECKKYSVDYNTFWTNFLAANKISAKQFGELDPKVQAGMRISACRSLERIHNEIPNANGETLIKAVTTLTRQRIDFLEKKFNKQIYKITKEEFRNGSREFFQNIERIKEEVSKLPEAERKARFAELTNANAKQYDAELSDGLFMYGDIKSQTKVALTYASSMTNGCKILKENQIDADNVTSEIIVTVLTERAKDGMLVEKDVKEASANLSSERSTEANKEYREAMVASRKENLNNPESLISDDIYQAESTGFRIGLNFNQNMTAEDIVALIQMWETTEVQFHTAEEFEQLKADVNKQIEVYAKEHPETAARTEEIKATQAKIKKQTDAATKTPSVSETGYVSKAAEQFEQAFALVKTSYEESGKATVRSTETGKNSTDTIQKINADRNTVLFIQKYGLEPFEDEKGRRVAAFTIATNPELSRLYKQKIAEMIASSYSPEEVKLIMPSMTTLAFTAMLSSASNDYVKVMAEEAQKNPANFYQKLTAENTIKKIDKEHPNEEKQTIAA